MDLFFFENFNYSINLYFLFSEELIIILLTYNFIKLIIFSSIFELIWPTQFFNKRNNFNNQIQYRNFTETFLKTNNNYYILNFFKKFTLKYFLIK